MAEYRRGCQVPQRGITGIFELPDMGAGIRTLDLMIEQQVFFVTEPFLQPLEKLSTAQRKQPECVHHHHTTFDLVNPSWAKLLQR